MRRRAEHDRRPDQPPFQLDLTIPGLKAAGAPSDRFRVSSETRDHEKRDEIVKEIVRLSLIPRWDVLLARIANRFTTREMIRAAGPGGESLDELLARTAPAAPPPVLPLLAPHIEPYLLTPKRNGSPREPEGVSRVRMQLGRFVEHCGGEDVALTSDLNDEKINQFLSGLTKAGTRERLDGQTLNRYRAALSGLATYCRKKNLIERHPLRDGIVLKYPERGGTRMPDWFGAPEYAIYFEAVRKYSVRVVLFFRLLIATGIDFEELLELKVRDITLGDEISILSATRGKTGVSRNIPFSAAYNAEVREHIATHKLKAHLKLFGMLKTTQTTSGLSCYEVTAAHLAGRAALGRMTAHEALERKVQRDNDQSFRVKDLRHVAAIAWVRGGVPLEQVQYFLGHKSITQTQVYARYRPDRGDHATAVRAQSKAFSVPKNEPTTE